MTTAELAEAKPYHHGDLRRALLHAAEAVLEREGPSALSLRAVAREAGVSPAAPYHHFKDKSELLSAVAAEGFSQLHDAMAAGITAASAGDKCRSIGVAYVEFAQANPALYRVMYDCARNCEALPEDMDDPKTGNGYQLVKDTISEAAGGELSALDLELTCIASWCAVHGLAEMCKLTKFTPLKEAMGGERLFLEAVLDHFGALSRTRTAST